MNYLEYSRHSLLIWFLEEIMCSFDIWYFMFILIWSFTLSDSTAAAFCQVRDSFAFTWSWFSIVSFVLLGLHHSCNGYKYWTEGFRSNLPACSLNALEIRSRPSKSWWTIPVLKCALFLSCALYNHNISFL